MDRLKRTMVLFTLIVLITTLTMPAQAQFFNGPQPYDMPQLPDSLQFPDDSTGMGPFGQPMPFMYPGMQDMPFMYPFMGMRRQSEQVTPITRLQVTQSSGKDMMATLESIPQLSFFTAALKASGYDEKLMSRGNYMVFAPIDKALQRDLSIKDVASLLDDARLIKGLVENSIVYQAPGRQQDNKNKTLTALNGKEIMMLKTKSGLAVNGADVLNYMGTGNGILIVTDGAVGT